MSDKNPEELKKYLKTFDRERLVQFAANYSSDFDPADYTTGGLRDFVFGYNDGAVTTLAVITALTFGSAGNLVVILGALANAERH